MRAKITITCTKIVNIDPEDYREDWDQDDETTQTDNSELFKEWVEDNYSEIEGVADDCGFDVSTQIEER